MASLRLSGVATPFVPAGLIDRPALETSVDAVRVPELAPGIIVVMGNPPSHEGPRVGGMVHAAGATSLHLAPDNPDLDPINMTFSQLKPLREAAERTVPAPPNAIRCLIDPVTPNKPAQSGPALCRRAIGVSVRSTPRRLHDAMCFKGKTQGHPYRRPAPFIDAMI
ncbi:hypothetical protein [Ancylobacter aquaticus]|uniref:hypothetical protein n=1 Tax=Ancylobacter aquaticus TaxID=100 RepID=UPI00105317B3|nr:hypothetical protein [Ancylobacter aquaticus]